MSGFSFSSLRWQIFALVSFFLISFVALVLALLMIDAKRAIAEEITASTRIATQFLDRTRRVYSLQDPKSLLAFLNELGRVRANEIEYVLADGTVLYRSPPSPYKAGRNAPAWFAAQMTPQTPRASFSLGNAQLNVIANPSRAVLDAWDDLMQALRWTALLLALSCGLAFWLITRALSPLREVVAGLERVREGDLSFRLPAFRSTELRSIRDSFNVMMTHLQRTFAVERAAQEAAAALQMQKRLASLTDSRIEQDRRQVAGDLHDDLGQHLTAIKAAASSLASKAEPGSIVAERGRFIISSAEASFDAVRRILNRLRPFTLKNASLADALQDLAGSTMAQSEHATRVTVHIATEVNVESLDEAIAIAIFRIVQEALSNAIRHGHASEIQIKLERETDGIALSVTDNGCGLAADAPPNEGFGLLGMRERLAHFHGTLTLEPRTPGLRVVAQFKEGREA
jgi:two-component system, NarL family, sensor histidine kinase UhpB